MIKKNMVKLISRTVQYIVLLYFIKSPSYNNTRTQKYLIFRIHKSTVSYCLCLRHSALRSSGERTRTQKHTSIQVYSRKGQHLSHASISGAQYRYITVLCIDSACPTHTTHNTQSQYEDYCKGASHT